MGNEMLNCDYSNEYCRVFNIIRKLIQLICIFEFEYAKKKKRNQRNVDISNSIIFK